MYGFPFTSDVSECLGQDLRLYRAASDIGGGVAGMVEFARTPLPRVFSTLEELDQAVSSLPPFCVTRASYAAGWVALVAHWRERPPLPCGASLAAITRADAPRAGDAYQAGEALRTDAIEQHTPTARRSRSLKRLLEARYPPIRQGLARIGSDRKGYFLELRHYAPTFLSAQASSHRPAPRPLPSPSITLEETAALPASEAINETADPFNPARVIVSEEGDGQPLHGRKPNAA